MEILFLLSMICLIAFMFLATYDGAYLHLWKYELFNRKESEFEHKTHKKGKSNSKLETFGLLWGYSIPQKGDLPSRIVSTLATV